MIPLETWYNDHVKKFNKFEMQNILNVQFFRDPPRPIIIDKSSFYSPCDGTILYQKTVTPTDQILEVKGMKYDLESLTQGQLKPDPINNPENLYDVIGVFMTFYDVHVIRMPTSGLLKWQDLDSIMSYNFPMLGVETALFANDPNYENMGLDYLFNNERRLNTIVNNKLNYKYHVVTIADEEIDCIMNYGDSGDFYEQGSRFSIIRWGSQCDMILPHDKRYNIELQGKELYHVEAGIDKLAKVRKK